MVFFDLPITAREKRRAYTAFKRFLLQDGYDMLQWSVYSRLVKGDGDVEKHLQHLKDNLPTDGCVRCMKISEEQYASMMLLTRGEGDVDRAAG